MAVILVDFENVNATNGLFGVEHLNEGDKLYLFYSKYCDKIRTDLIRMIEASGCEFKSFKLQKTGKNALDFYIAAECGVLYGQGIRRVAIVSKDRGYSAVCDYLRMRDHKMNLVIAPNVERAIVSVNEPGDEKRRELIKEQQYMVDIQEEQTRIETRRIYRERLKKALAAEGMEQMFGRVIDYIEGRRENSPKEIYTGSLHEFGRDAGCKIYRILKAVS